MPIDENAVYVSIGGKIKDLREQKGLSQEQLAKIIDVTRATLANYESGKQFVFISGLYQLAEYFEVAPTYFLPSLEDVTVISPIQKVQQASNLNTLEKQELIKFIEEDHRKGGQE